MDTKEICAKLRTVPQFFSTDGFRWYASSDKEPLAVEAADLIERLEAERDALRAAFVELDAAEFAYAKFTRDEGMEKHRQNRERRIAAWQAARALVGLHDGSKPPAAPVAKP